MTAQGGEGATERVARDSLGAVEIGFSLPEIYNASELLFGNLDKGFGEKVALYSNRGDVTYRTLCEQAAKTGNALASLGLKRGDRVLLLLDDTPAYAAIMFGAIRAGFVPLLINTLSPKNLIKFYLEDSGAHVAFVDQVNEGVFDQEIEAETNLETLVCVNGSSERQNSIPRCDWHDWIEGFSDALDVADTHRDDVAFWMYSSGSTGLPKGIVHLQHDMEYTVRSFARYILDINSDDICFSIPKIFFAYGLGNSVVFPFSVGASAVLLEGRFYPDRVIEYVERYKPTLFFGLPTLYNALIKSDGIEKADFSSVRLCLSAAERLYDELSRIWKEYFGLELVEGLGSTELTHVYLSNRGGEVRSGAAGQRVPGYEVKLLDKDNKPVEAGQEGVMWVRADSSAPCYWNRPDKTAQTMRDDWMWTGDLFVEDEDGFFFFKGRADDLIKVSGQWVYPLEIELCLNEHYKIRECAVIGLEKDSRMTLKAYVVVNDGVSVDDDLTRELQTYVKKKLLPYKYPRTIEYRQVLAKTGTDKIDRQALVSQE